MVNTSLLKKLLNTEGADLKKLDVEQVRLILGSFRYCVRILEREINQRSFNQPLGKGV